MSDSNSLEYSVYPLDLSTAGEEKIPLMAGAIAFVDAQTASGAQALDALINLQFDNRSRDKIPTRLGFYQAIGKPRTVYLSWDAQPGVTAKFLFADASDILDLVTRPTRQLVTSAIGSSATATRETVGTTAASVISANGSRQAVGFKADPANSGTIYLETDSGVTTGNGFPLAAGETAVLHVTGEVYAIASAAGQTLHVLEED
jgi:hypothetical protein